MSLVALCFVAVLGIALASYIALCSHAMKLSNRTFHDHLSRQLAEFGIEEGLRAFNKNSWSGWASNPTGITGATTAWTLDTTNHRASRTINFTSGKLGQGTTATVKIRIDNYDAAVLGVTYSNSRTYNTNELVGSGGVWYRSIRNSNTGNALTGTGGYPNLAYWAPEPIPWAWSSGRLYTAYVDVVSNGGTWYRCISTHTSVATFPGAGATWVALPAPPVLAIYTNTSYAAGTFAFRVGASAWLRCINTHTVSASWDASEAAKWDAADATTPTSTTPAISWAYRSGATYKFNDLVYYSSTNGVAGSWYRCKAATSTNAPTNTTDWEPALTGNWNWSSGGFKYNLGDVVYYSGLWYRCILAHTSSGSTSPTATTYWATDPLYTPAWDAARQYNQNDTVYHNGVWYLCIWIGGHSGQNPATSTGYWIGANTTSASYRWNSTTNFGSGVYRCYGGVWYRSLSANTNRSPNDTTYWTPTWNGTLGVTTGATVIYAEATVNIAGSPTVRTQLRAPINPASLLPNAIGATDTLSLGAGGTVDSYDSNVAAYVSPGTYAAVVASTYSAGTAVTVFGAKIQGYVAVPSASSTPYGALASFGGNAELKTTAATPSPTKADPARISRSPSVPVFATVPGGADGLTAAWGSTPRSTQLATSGTGLNLNIGTPGATTPTRYHCTSLTIDGTSISSLTINGPVILYVQNSFILGGATSNTVTITSTGSAEIHVGGSLNINQTSGGIVNVTKDPKKCVIICDSSGSGTYNYSDGDNDFYGVVYAPYFSNSATGFVVDNSSVTIYGAISAKKVAYSADANLHYDTALRNTLIPGVDQPYTTTEIRELPQVEQATMP